MDIGDNIGKVKILASQDNTPHFELLFSSITNDGKGVKLSA
jgi:hypothetical protein